MQIDADPEKGIAEDHQQQPESDFIVENPTLGRIFFMFSRGCILLSVSFRVN